MQVGKIAGLVISLLSLGGILIAAGSKVQHLFDDLAGLHQQVEKQEERLQQNEANDSRRAEEISYLKGKLEQNPARENRPEGHTEFERREKNEEVAPARRPFRPDQKTSSPTSPPPPLTSNAIHISDKLYTTILYYYRQALRLQPNLAGRLTVICKMDHTGYLAATEVIASAPELTGLAERLAAKIRRWKSPEHVTGLEGNSFHKTYFLSPQGF